MGWIVLLIYMLQMQSVRESTDRCGSTGREGYMEKERYSFPTLCEEVGKDSCADNAVTYDRNIIHEKSEEKIVLRDDMPKAWQMCIEEYEKSDF